MAPFFFEGPHSPQNNEKEEDEEEEEEEEKGMEEEEDDDDDLSGLGNDRRVIEIWPHETQVTTRLKTSRSNHLKIRSNKYGWICGN